MLSLTICDMVFVGFDKSENRWTDRQTDTKTDKQGERDKRIYLPCDYNNITPTVIL